MHEIFKITNRPHVFTKEINVLDNIPNIAGMCFIGAFDKLYHFHDLWTPHQEYALAEWLSLNCTANFIFVKLQIGVLAGGTENNSSYWSAIKTKKWNSTPLTLDDYFLKLYEADVIMFEMVWLTNFLDSV
jgi:hypothetical protein